MKSGSKNYLLILLALVGINSFGQAQQFKYRRELSEPKDQWHKIVLPDELFEKVSPDLRDIRIYGIKKNADTIEVPYILRLAEEKTLIKEESFKLINESRDDKGFYYTFEIAEEKLINQIKLNFSQQNFDWKVKLEGSQNQKSWFIIAENYRILSLHNESSDYQFTAINFPSSNYRYYRLFIPAEKNPELLSAAVLKLQAEKGIYRKFPVSKSEISQDKKLKQTIITIDLQTEVPVSVIKITVQDTIDFYRPVAIQYLTDSIQVQEEWKYLYSTLANGTLNSIESNELKFKSTILKKLRIIIENNDNEPLKIDSLEVKGFEYSLIARFTEPATYYLTYGNNKKEKPRFDIALFTDKIPQNLVTIKVGEEEFINPDKASEHSIFENKLWLWAVMAVIIFVLGWFSLSMIRKK